MSNENADTTVETVNDATTPEINWEERAKKAEAKIVEMKKNTTTLAILFALLITLSSTSALAERHSHEEEEIGKITSFLGLMEHAR